MYYLLVFIVAACSLVYELLLSTLSSYLLWNTILQFSLTIWIFMFWLGIGSYFSKFPKNHFKTFIYVEILLGLIGGLSVLFIKWMYILLEDYTILFNLLYFVYVIVIWILTGFEIPMVSAILYEGKNQDDDDQSEFKWVIWDVFTYDYIWALLATFIFPFILLPYLGLTYTALVVGFFNLIVSFTFLIQKEVKQKLLETKSFYKSLILILSSMFILILGGVFASSKFETIWDHFYYKEPIVLKEHSKYQEIVITKRWNDIRLMLDGHLQFLSLDEHRYHDSLWTVANHYTKNLTWNINLLILWWWDGLLARNMIESLSWKNFKITLVDLDPKITHLAQTYPLLIKLNKNSLNNPNVKVINNDAFKFLEKNNKKYDVIIADFPDPRAVELSKLYSKEFYLLVLSHLKDNWIFTTQSWNSFFTKESFWCIYKTIESIWQKPFAYHAYIPSFGDWGFIWFKKWTRPPELTWKYIITKFDKDYLVDLASIQANSLDHPVIMDYYLQGRKRYNY